MKAVLLFIAVVIGLNIIPPLFKRNFPKTERKITQILAVSTVIFLLFAILSLNGIKLKGLYSNSAVGTAFILTSILYFVLVQNTKRKILSVVLLIPLILWSILTLLFGRPIYEKKISDQYEIEVSTGGILSCGELIHITKTTFGIFEKAVHYESSLCLRKIERIETIKFDKNSAEFLIYHNEDMDSENPYNYTIANKGEW